MSKKLDIDTILITFVFLLIIFIAGIQIGIKEGRELQIKEFLESGYNISD